MSPFEAVRSVRRKVTRFLDSTHEPSCEATRRFIHELDADLDQVDTVEIPQLATVKAETLEHLLRTGIVYRACIACEARSEDCRCAAEANNPARSVLLVDHALLRELSN